MKNRFQYISVPCFLFIHTLLLLLSSFWFYTERFYISSAVEYKRKQENERFTKNKDHTQQNTQEEWRLLVQTFVIVVLQSQFQKSLVLTFVRYFCCKQTNTPKWFKEQSLYHLPHDVRLEWRGKGSRITGVPVSRWGSLFGLTASDLLHWVEPFCNRGIWTRGPVLTGLVSAAVRQVLLYVRLSNRNL